MAIIDGKAIADKINLDTRRRVRKLVVQGVVPKLAVILVGNDSASETYVAQKTKMARALGIDFVLSRFPAGARQDDLTKEIQRLQEDPALTALLIQLPLPENLYRPDVLNAIRPEFDVDFLSEHCLGTLLTGSNELEPPTSGAIMRILRALKINLSGRVATVVGMGALVGKPLSLLLEKAGATVIACNSKTKNLPTACLDADIIVSCVGRKNLIRGNMVKRGAVVIDAGFTFSHGRPYGDVNFAEVSPKAKYITPTPGGVGPVTVAALLNNVALMAERQLIN